MRANYSQLAPESFKAMMALEGTLTLDTTIKELVKLHISQINGCTFCTDMHAKEAKLHGERELRLYHLPVGANHRFLRIKNVLRWSGPRNSPALKVHM